MTLHVVSLPHTRVEQSFSGCAYTAKVLKFAKMMSKQYCTLIYAPEGPQFDNDAILVDCMSDKLRQDIFGKDDSNRLPAWPTDAQAAAFNHNVIDAIRARIEPHDLILLTAGRTQSVIRGAFPNHIVCEPGVGYEGILPNTHCAFESYSHMHTVYAKNNITGVRWFDAVIPNYFDADDFPLTNKGGGKYLMFLGRLIPNKGAHIAAEIADACGMELVVAGAGAVGHNSNLISCADDYNIKGKNLRYVGPVGPEKRAELLAGARALIVPTTYIEPFGGVAVEAMMCGTPVITTDAGAFTETVTDEDGFRFHTLSEAIDAVDQCQYMNHSRIKVEALLRFGLNAVRPQFDRWFKRLSTLWGKGYYDGVAVTQN